MFRSNNANRELLSYEIAPYAIIRETTFLLGKIEFYGLLSLLSFGYTQNVECKGFAQTNITDDLR